MNKVVCPLYAPSLYAPFMLPAYRQTGPDGLPLALRLSEGLGLTGGPGSCSEWVDCLQLLLKLS